MQIIEGKLDAFYETGTEGVIWSVYENGKYGYEALNILNYGDYLRIYSNQDRNEIIWEGNIYLDWEINWRKYPNNPKYGQQEVLGYWVHGIQKDVEPTTWGRWFFSGLPAQLIKTDLGRFYPLKDKHIKAHAFSGEIAYFHAGTPGDLILVFDDCSYVKFFGVDPQIYTDFLNSKEKHNYFMEKINNKYRTEKITPFFPF